MPYIDVPVIPVPRSPLRILYMNKFHLQLAYPLHQLALLNFWATNYSVVRVILSIYIYDFQIFPIISIITMKEILNIYIIYT